MSLENLITDRTAQDVDRVNVLASKAWQDMTADERSEWLSPLKGAYNHTDLNRVGAALNYVRNRLIESGYLWTGVFEARVDWRGDEIPSASDVYDYLRYVRTIREALAQLPTTPLAPTNPELLDYQEANNIEQIIFDVDLLIDKMIPAQFFSADIYSGEV